MKKYDYLGSQVITVGGMAILPTGLTKLDSRTLDLAIKNKVIKEITNQENGKESKKRGNSKRNNSKSGS